MVVSPQTWYIRAEEESFDIDVYGDFPKSLFEYTYTNLFSIKLHYGERFTDSPNKQYVDVELCFVDMVDIDDFKVDLLNTVIGIIGYEDDDELVLYYKIPLKSSDVGLKHVVSDTNIINKNFIGYVKKHKIMDFYLKLVEKTESSSNEDGQSDSESEDVNDFVDEEHLVEEVEVNMTSFNIQLDWEDETDFINHTQPHVNVIEDDLEVLDFDSLESDQEDVPENARTKERIRAYAVETRQNLDFKVNDKRRIRVVYNGVVPTWNSKNEYVDKVQGQKQDISEKDKGVMQDAKEDKISCPWLLYLSKEDNQSENGRELLGLDGAFMRGQYHGQMLTMVGMDTNNGIYPVSYGILESENQYSWTWFLTCLANVDLFTNSNFTFITDRQKGLVPTIAKLFPAAKHRQLVYARDSPMITSLEYVREYLMKRIVIVQKIIQKIDGPLTPAITKLLNKIKEAASECTMDWNGLDIFQVKDNGMDVGTPEDWVHESYKI
nr:transposase, mutator type [Tanacetum cinerariifolium]